MHSTATLKLCLLVAPLMTLFFFFLKKKRFSFFPTLLPECWFPFDTLLTQRICFPHQSRAQAVSHVARHPILKFCPCFCHWQLHLWLQAASSLGTFNMFFVPCVVLLPCHSARQSFTRRGEVLIDLFNSLHSVFFRTLTTQSSQGLSDRPLPPAPVAQKGGTSLRRRFVYLSIRRPNRPWRIHLVPCSHHT